MRTMCCVSSVIAALMLSGAPLLSVAEETNLAKDLTAVIALMGKPCGEVVNVVHQGDNDNVATCKDGNRYHVYLNADKRVVVDKQ